MNDHDYCVIMAGGIGSRFWPLSRTTKPKQFLDILGTGKTLLQQTFDRFASLIPVENIFIVSNSEYFDEIREQLPLMKSENILLEPYRRNTAPCIAYATYRIKAQDPEARMVVAPSDHIILKESDFLEFVKESLDFVGKNHSLVTLGIKPCRPETGYGYIQACRSKIIKQGDVTFHKVKTFTEKPDLKLANIFLESGEFFWNSGIFFWSVETILASFEKHLSEVNDTFAEGEKIYGTSQEMEFIERTYAGCRNISIDYGIMEKADNAYVLTVDIGWSDLGTWGSLHEMRDKDNNNNSLQGEHVLLYDVSNSVVNAADDKLVVLQGLDGFIVVETDDVLLVCRKEEEQRIKTFVNDVKLKTGDEFI